MAFLYGAAGPAPGACSGRRTVELKKLLTQKF